MDARHLLTDGPDGYVPARTASVKAAKAAKDKPLAAELQALSKPTAALWAVLAAADDAALVRDAVSATSQLATVQAAGDRTAIVAATKHRKELVERVIAAAVTDAGRWGDVPGPRKDEIRRIVERLTRAPEAVDAWVEATLRTLPDDAGGFSAFADMTLAPPPPRDRPTRPAPTRSPRHGQHTVDTSDDVLTASRETAAEPEPARRPRVDPVAVRRAERALATAERDLASAGERLTRAEAAAADAAAQLERARAAVAEAEQTLAARRDERRRPDEPTA